MAKKMCGQAGGAKAEAETESSYVSMNLGSSPAVGGSGSGDTAALSDDYILMKWGDCGDNFCSNSVIEGTFKYCEIC